MNQSNVMLKAFFIFLFATHNLAKGQGLNSEMMNTDKVHRQMKSEFKVSHIMGLNRHEGKVSVLLSRSPRDLWISGENPCLEEFYLLIDTAKTNNEKVQVEINRQTGEIIDVRPAPTGDTSPIPAH